jgi:hypothetical protein
MSDKSIIALIVGLGVVALAVAVPLILRSAHEPSPSVQGIRAGAPIATMRASVTTQHESQPATPAQGVNDELARLRAENAQLRQAAKIAPARSADEPSIEGFRQFAARFIVEMKADVAKRAEQSKALIAGQHDGQDELELMSTDLKKTDSIVSPVVGVATIRQTYTSTNKNSGFYFCATTTHAFTFGFKDGKWDPIKLVDTLDSQDVIPEQAHANPEIGHPQERLTTTWADAVARAQR